MFTSGEISPNPNDNGAVLLGSLININDYSGKIIIKNTGTETALWAGFDFVLSGNTTPINPFNYDFTGAEITVKAKPFTYTTFEANKSYLIDISGVTENNLNDNTITLNTDSTEEKTITIFYTYVGVATYHIEPTTITTTDKDIIIPLHFSDLLNENIILTCNIDLNIGRILNTSYVNTTHIPTSIQKAITNLTDVEELTVNYIITGDRILRHITTNADHTDLTIKAFDENDVELFSDTLDTKAGVEETIGLNAGGISKLTFSEPITIDDIDFVDGGITPHDWIVGIANEKVKFNIGTDLTNAYEILLKTILIDNIGTYNVTLQGISGSTTTDIYVNNSVIGDFEERITFTEFELYKVIISGENINEYSRTFTELPKELKLVILKYRTVCYSCVICTICMN